MGHFVGHVLPASQTFGVDTDLGQEEVNSTQEVSQSLVVDDTLRSRWRQASQAWAYPSPNRTMTDLVDGIADGHLSQGSLSTLLDFFRQQVQDDVLSFGISGVPLVLGVDIVLDLGHGEFTVTRTTSKQDKTQLLS